MTNLYSINQAVDETGVGYSIIVRRMKEGAIRPSFLLNDVALFTKSDLDKIRAVGTPRKSGRKKRLGV